MIPESKEPLFAHVESLRIRAYFLGTRLDVRALEKEEPLALAPLTMRAGWSGCAVLFRFGVVTLVGLDAEEEKTYLEQLAPYVSERFGSPQVEDIEIAIDPGREERVDPNGILVLRAAGLDRVQIVSQVLAKSTVLAHYEERVAGVFDRIERLALQLQRGARSRASGRDLLRQIGDVLLTQTWTVGRVEVTEKPETTWDHPELDRLYERLAIEYELRDRDLALARKLDLVARTVQTFLDLLRNRQSLRVEWYIVILILIEIVIILVQMFLAG